ncbi:MAG: adenylate/guanylate cyclase domain-containing protein [Methylococcales bacterium]|nr:adenylate/guanylate cyclase domain-containing protein [Methylococcales bacterium]
MQKKSKLFQDIWLFLILIFILIIQIHTPDIIIKTRHFSYDLFQRIHPRDYQPAPVKIIAIDNESLDKIGQFPWSRLVIANMIEKLTALEAKVIVFDMMFSEKDRTSPTEIAKNLSQYPTLSTKLAALPDHDDILIAAMQKTQVVTGFMLKNKQTTTRLPMIKKGFMVKGNSVLPALNCLSNTISSLPKIEQAASGNGTFAYFPDEDGVIRTAPLVMCVQNKPYPSITSEALRLFQKKGPYFIETATDKNNHAIQTMQIAKLKIKPNASGEILLHYTHTRPSRYISAWKLLENHVLANEIKGKIIYIGVTASALKDMRFTPFGYSVAGVEIHAQLTEQLLQNSYLIPFAWTDEVNSLFLLLIWGIFYFFKHKMKAIALIFIGLIAIAILCSTSWYLFTIERQFFDPIAPSVFVILLFIIFTLQKQWQTEREKRWLRDAFGRYVSPNRVKYLVEHPESLSLGGEYRECSFVMTDLADFTALMEKTPPHECVLMLNHYLDGMINIAFKYHGTLDRIVGDAVAVIFSAPIIQNNHRELALQCALAMDEYAMKFSKNKGGQGIVFGITRIGVCSGNVLIGNFGGKVMFDYRALGDPINTASRLESANKQFGTRICVAESTIKHIQHIKYRPIGCLILKGKKEKIKTFELLTEAQFNHSLTQDYLLAYQKMEQQTPDAMDAFATLFAQYPQDPLINYHYKRFQQQQIGSTIIMESK